MWGPIIVGIILLILAVVAARAVITSHWMRVKLGRGLGLDELCRRLDMSEPDLRDIPISYQTATIPKRRGGVRTLHVPNPQLKQLQRRILRRLLARLRTHTVATGFEPGLSIAHNARAHAEQAMVIKMDIVDFFTTTLAHRLDLYFRRVGWNAEVAALLVEHTTHDGGLPQGAPTSPRLSNLVNYLLDTRIDGYVRHRGGMYTRYADDITISYPHDDGEMARQTIMTVRRILLQFGYRHHVRKERILRRHQQQRVTGLVVNDRVNLPRATRRQLRAIEHRLDNGRRATMTRAQLDGWRSLEAMIADQTASTGGPAGTDR